jgi:crossover junction endodeoxyribonuclease RuvC
MNNILGIDPGLDGAIAVLTEDGALLAIHDMPTIAGEGAKNRRSISSPLLAHIIRTAAPVKAYCELVGPRPTDGVVGAFGFGRSRGQIEGVLAALCVPVEMIAPPTWKRAASIPPGREHKDVARSRAISRWPSQAALFARKADCDRAEAALIAAAGLARLNSVCESPARCAS